MREILFKAKRLDNGEWIEGYYIGKSDPLLDTKYSFIVAQAKGESYVTWHKVDRDTVCQYTGLKDSYENKVFEGDEIKTWDRKELNVVKYGKFNCGCCYDVYGFYFEGCEDGNQWHDNIINGRVVGNIHDKGE